MTQITTRVFFDVARIRGLSAAAVFCDLGAAFFSEVRQYVVGSDLPEQRLLVLMDILGLNFVQRSEPVTFLRAEGSLLKSAGLSLALQQLVRDMKRTRGSVWMVRPSSRAYLLGVVRASRLLIWQGAQ